MTLLIACAAAVTATLVWYLSKKARALHIGTLALMYWGAAVMWLVDAVKEFAELRAAYFTPTPADMLNDAFLGCSVVVLGLVIWIVMILVKDPDGIIRQALEKKN